MAAKVIDLAARRRRRAELRAMRALGTLAALAGIAWLLRRHFEQMFPPAG